MQKDYNKAQKMKKKFKPPKLNVECVEDRYVLYVLISGIDSETFWHSPISSVERIYSGKLAFDGWQNSPQEVK